MKGMTEPIDFLGIMFIMIGVLVVTFALSTVIYGNLFKAGCEAKENQALSEAMGAAQRPGSQRYIKFIIPDCVQDFKAGSSISPDKCNYNGNNNPCNELYTYCFKEYGQDYRCTDTSVTGENVQFIGFTEISQGPTFQCIQASNSGQPQIQWISAINPDQSCPP